MKRPLGAAIVPLLAGTSCGPPDASVSLRIPSDVLDRTEWIEVGFMPAGCPPLGALAEGLPPGATTGRVAFRKGDAKPPAVGLVATGKYGIAATARDATCAVLAMGCTNVDLGADRNLQIALSASASSGGACSPGTTCSYARCVPPTTPSDPSVGEGCSLQLMGAGPLGNPLATETQVGSPAVVPTDTGFLIAYREFEPISGIGRLTLYPVDNGGAALPAHVETLAGRCPGADETDGVGLSLVGQTGLVVLARSPCMGKSGYDYFLVTPTADVTKYNVDNSAMGATLALSPAHAIAPGVGGQTLIGVRVGTTALLQTTDGVLTMKGNDKIGSAMDTGVWVTSSNKLVAALIAGPSKAPVPDGGLPEGGTMGPVLRLHAAPLGTALGSLPAAIEFPGTWGSLAALGTRLMVVSSGTTSGKPVSYRAFDLVGNTVSAGPSDGFNTNSLQGKPIFADVALVNDTMLVAVEQPGSISLVAFDHATTTPVFKREVDLGDDPRLPSIKNVRDGRIAIAASPTRVAVVWATGATLDMNDPVGGYAVFACR
jgi:hypothetical protein